jgi:hypothetical protein
MSDFRTPPELADRWGISPAKVLSFIRRGELTAVNLATRLGGRPRWAISAEAVAAFERRRSSAATATPRPQRRPRAPLPANVIQFI